MVSGTINFVRKHWAPLLIAVTINMIVLNNTVTHPPKIGYDVTEHLTNIQVYPLRFPTPQDSTEFFSAPLSYLLPSIYDKFCVSNLPPGAELAVYCRGSDGRVAQWINLLLSIGSTSLMWKITELLRPGSISLKISTLSLLGILTVYYRTFSQARAEPYVAFFICLAMLQVLQILINRDTGWKQGIKLGLTLGLLILSRQWGFFIFPAFIVLVLVLLVQDASFGWQMFRVLAISGLIAFIIGGLVLPAPVFHLWVFYQF